MIEKGSFFMHYILDKILTSICVAYLIFGVEYPKCHQYLASIHEPSTPVSSDLLNPLHSSQINKIDSPDDLTQLIVPTSQKIKPLTTYESNNLLMATTTFTGSQAYMAIRGNNYYTGLFDYIITFSLNNNTGALTNRQQTNTQIYATVVPAPLNFALILQGQLPSDILTQSVVQISWTVVNDTAYLATRGYITNFGLYIGIYTLDPSTDQLINNQIIAIPQTESINDMQWVVVNGVAYLAIWGFDSQYSQYYIGLYRLDQASGGLINPQRIFFPQGISINQISWTVNLNTAYLAIFGPNTNKNLYYILTYTLDSVNGILINPQNTYMASGESIIQIEWVVLNNISYLATNSYDLLSNRPFIATFTLTTNTGGLTNKYKSYLLQQENCNQIEWVVVNNNAYLGFWGFDSLQNRYILSTFILNQDTGALNNRHTQFTTFGQMINFITWVVINNTAYLATPGFDNFQSKAFVGIYTLNVNSQYLNNLQLTFFQIQTSVNQIEWVVVNNTAYLGARGYDSLQDRFYQSVFTLNTNYGGLSNKQIRLASSGETYYQFEWVAI